MPHHLSLCVSRKTYTVYGDAHAVEPCITGSRVDFDMGVHGPHIRMAILFDVETRAAEEPRKKIELLNSRMRNAVPSQMEYGQGFAFWFILDDVIERLDQTAHTFFAADAFIK